MATKQFYVCGVWLIKADLKPMHPMQLH